MTTQPKARTGEYGVFKLVNGAWIAVSVWSSKSAADYDAERLVKHHGLTVQVFVKL